MVPRPALLRLFPQAFVEETAVLLALGLGSCWDSVLGKELGKTSRHPMPIGYKHTQGILNPECYS